MSQTYEQPEAAYLTPENDREKSWVYLPSITLPPPALSGLSTSTYHEDQGFPHGDVISQGVGRAYFDHFGFAALQTIS